MRDMKFRAKVKREVINLRGVKLHDEGDWYFFTLKPGIYIPYWLDINTLSQYTGLKDKNGTEIYEGDIVESVVNKKETDIGVVDWDCECPGWVLKRGKDRYHHITGLWDRSVSGDQDSVKPLFKKDRNNHNKEVVGNIDDQPELLDRQ